MLFFSKVEKSERLLLLNNKGKLIIIQRVLLNSRDIVIIFNISVGRYKQIFYMLYTNILTLDVKNVESY